MPLCQGETPIGQTTSRTDWRDLYDQAQSGASETRKTLTNHSEQEVEPNRQNGKRDGKSKGGGGGGGGGSVGGGGGGGGGGRGDEFRSGRGIKVRSRGWSQE